MSKKLRIGIDVGGTNTDAVILRCKSETGSASDAIAAWSKCPTTPDVTSGISTALKGVLQQSQIDKKDILYISIGTTHFLNAVIEADPRRLSKVAVLRLSGPYTARCPPFTDFPSQLRHVIEGHVALIDGGLEIDGKEITPIRDEEVSKQAEIIYSKGIRNIAVVGVFSPLASEGTQEEYVKAIIERTLGKAAVNVVCSKDVGQIGLLERENASILNASILSFARRTVSAYYNVLKQTDLTCPLYLTQLDGTLVPASVAVAIPIRTFSNGPTNSMRGAAYLSGFNKKDPDGKRKSVIVVDVGGTTTDVGVLLPSGFPRKAAAVTYVGGVRTSFSMPDIHSIGLGGGSRVRFSPLNDASVGPDSVGHEITTRAIVFGGDDLTATDLAVSASLQDTSSLEGSHATIGDPKQIAGHLTAEQTATGIERIKKILEDAIDRVKTEPDDVRMLLVGGGAVLVPKNLKGVGEIVRPPCFDVANAVGAAIARVAGEVDRVEIPGGTNGDIEEIVTRCKQEAVRHAVANGASQDGIEIAEVAVIQLPYVANHASRVVVRAVGDLDLDFVQNMKNANDELTITEDTHQDEVTVPMPDSSNYTDEPVQINPFAYKPNVSASGIWTLTETDMEWLADGCAVMGCGGGGATYAAFLMARAAIRAGRTIRVVSADYLLSGESSRPDAWIAPCGFMGSPSVSSERIPSGEEIPAACVGLRQFLGLEDSEIAALISDEIGGKNGLEPMLLAARDGFSLPVIDGDLMGRAYPRLDQIIPCISKKNGLYPVSAADGVGNCMIVPQARNNAIVEDMLRAACTALGSSVALAISPLRASELREHAILGTTSQAWRIGRVIAHRRKTSNLGGIPEAVTALQGGRPVFVGKIVNVKREVRGGFTHGCISITPLVRDESEGNEPTARGENIDGTTLLVPFQNENLCAELVHADGTRKMLATVPDLIAVLDSVRGSALGTQDYRYGLRVSVLALAGSPQWTKTEQALKLGGPEAFGINAAYSPIAPYIEPRSVIEEFRARAT